MVKVLILILSIFAISIIVHRLDNKRKKKIAHQDEENLKNTISLSFSQNGMVKEKIHSIKKAYNWFEEGLKNQNMKNYKSALNFYFKALNIFTKKDYPYAFAAIRNNIGNIYKELGNKKNISYMYKAIDAYKEALAIYKNLRYEMEYAMTKNNLGISYIKLAEMTRDEKFLYNGVKAFKDALSIYKIENYPMEYASIQNNLGDLYQKIAQYRNKKRNLLNAIRAYKEAMKVLNIVWKITMKGNLAYADIQRKIGKVYSELYGIEKKDENIAKAIEFFKNALRIYSIENHPKKYADVQRGIGKMFLLACIEEKNLKDIMCYSHHMVKSKLRRRSTPVKKGKEEKILEKKEHEMRDEERVKEENLINAINAYKEALKVYNLEENPMEYAEIQTTMGISYRTLSTFFDKEENLNHSIRAFKEALKVYNLEENPMEYAATQNNLGISYRNLAMVVDMFANFEKAMEAYEEALKVYTLKDYPQEYAMLQNNIGNIYAILAGLKMKIGFEQGIPMLTA